MKHLIIFAHPNHDSLNGELKQTLVEHLQEKGHEVKNPDPKGQALVCYPHRGINRKPVKGILSIFYFETAKPTVSDLAQRTRFYRS